MSGTSGTPFLDLSNPKTVKKYLKRCHLPATPFTSYVFKQMMRKDAQKKMATMSMDQIHTMGYFPSEKNGVKLRTTILETLFPYVPKDVDLLEYNLGQPVSVAEAQQVFVETRIDWGKVPPSQKELLNLQNNTMMDVITLQEMPLSDFVQLKVTGELMTRDTLKDFIQRSTTQWMGKQNVGFKTPEGAILGNLVLFNFDEKRFFPQRPGTLTITEVPNLSNILSQTHPSMTLPKKFFRLEYMHHVSFLPDTPEGRIVLGLMKDAFKKGNLYGLTRSGHVRQGRVHKKTALSGTAYSYPDNTYLERVSGELAALGSTPFLYQFSNDPDYSPYRDPYPLERRFVIRRG